MKKNHTLSSSYRYIFKIIYILTNLKIYHKKSKVNVKTSYLFGFNFLFQFSFKFHVLEKNKTCMKCKSVYVKFKRDQAVNLTHLYYLSRLVFSVLLVVFRLFKKKSLICSEVWLLSCRSSSFVALKIKKTFFSSRLNLKLFS